MPATWWVGKSLSLSEGKDVSGPASEYEMKKTGREKRKIRSDKKRESENLSGPSCYLWNIFSCFWGPTSFLRASHQSLGAFAILEMS